MPWMTILEWGLKLVGWVIGKRAKDKETHKKFLELTHHIQSKGLISARFRASQDERLANLDARMDFGEDSEKKKEE